MTDDVIDVLALREARGWTQLQLAEFCGTDRSTVSKWEKEPPTKGPALVLLKQLRDGAIPSDATSPGVAAGPDNPPEPGPATLTQEAAE